MMDMPNIIGQRVGEMIACQQVYVEKCRLTEMEHLNSFGKNMLIHKGANVQCIHIMITLCTSQQ